MGACHAMPAGTMGEMSGNSLACRQYHLGAAAGNATAHCPHAGPLGQDPAAGPTCGSMCEHYCDVVDAYCTGALQVYANRQACLASCANIFADGTPIDTSGDSLQCRAYHASAAAVGPIIHCVHTGPASAPCSDAPPEVVSGCTAGMFESRTGQVTVSTTAASTYTPKCLKVRAGTEVTIGASATHPLQGQADVGGLSNPYAGAMQSTMPVTRTLETEGLLGFYCTVHGDPAGNGMAGAIWVVP